LVSNWSAIGQHYLSRIFPPPQTLFSFFYQLFSPQTIIEKIIKNSFLSYVDLEAYKYINKYIIFVGITLKIVFSHTACTGLMAVIASWKP
jgi:hypothetical protein